MTCFLTLVQLNAYLLYANKGSYHTYDENYHKQCISIQEFNIDHKEIFCLSVSGNITKTKFLSINSKDA